MSSVANAAVFLYSFLSPSTIPVENSMKIIKKDGLSHLLKVSVSYIPIDYPIYLTTFETKLVISKNESLTNSFASVLTGLFSIQSKM